MAFAAVNVSAEVQSLSESSNPPGGEPNIAEGARLPFGTLSACVVVSAAVLVGAVFAAPKEFRIALAIGGGLAAVLLCAAVTAAVYFREQVGRARRAGELRAAQAEARTTAVIAEAEARLADGQNRIQAVTEASAGTAREVKESENRRAAAMAAFAGAAGRMQAMSTSMLAELREMEHRHGDPKILADLLELDHRTAQAGRLADSIAVLSGARSGRRWAKPIAMESILRGAMGRVAGYQRVRLRAVAEIAVAGHAAEGVMHALAELLDNACNFSPPTTEVHVYAAEVPAGVVITIEDSGLVMSESALRRAELTVSGRTGNSSGFGGGNTRGARNSETTGRNSLSSPSDLSSLSGTRLGLAVVGYLARKHSLTVSYRPSAIGGTAVVVVVPRELTTRLDRTGTLSAIPLPARSLSENTSTPTGSAPALVSTDARSDTAPALLTVDITHTAPARAIPAPDRGGSPVALGTTDPARSGEFPAVPKADPARPGTPPVHGSAEPLHTTGATPAIPSAAAVFGPPMASRSDDVPAGPDQAPGFSGSTSVLADRFAEAAETASEAAPSMGLPKRQRGRTLAAVHPEGLAAPDVPAGAPPRPSSPDALGAFQRAVSGRENAGTAIPLETEP